MRRLTLAGISAALVLVIVAGCGGGSSTPSPSAASETEAPITTEAPVVTQAPEATTAPTAAPAGTIYHAVCGQVALREGPGSDQGLVVRVAKGTKVRVVEVVTGASYAGSSCGEAGDQWLKITKVGGKAVKTQYKVDAVYAAAGFFGEGQP